MTETITIRDLATRLDVGTGDALQIAIEAGVRWFYPNGNRVDLDGLREYLETRSDALDDTEIDLPIVMQAREAA